MDQDTDTMNFVTKRLFTRAVSHNRPITHTTTRRSIHLAVEERRIGCQSSHQEAATLVFNHCLLGSRHSFTPLLRTLDNIYQSIHQSLKVILIDARNHGDSSHTQEHSYRSMIDDLSHLIKSNQTINQSSNVILIGHSMGARTIMGLSLIDDQSINQSINSMVILDASPATYLHTHSHLFDAMNQIDCLLLSAGVKGRSEADVMLRDLGKIDTKSERAFALMNLIDSKLIINPDHYDKQRLSTLNHAWKCNLPVLTRDEKFMHIWPDFLSVNNLDNTSSNQSIKPFEKPTLFIGGSQSTRLTLPCYTQDIPRMFPNHSIKMVDANHFPHLSHATFCAEQIKRLIEHGSVD